MGGEIHSAMCGKRVINIQQFMSLCQVIKAKIKTSRNENDFFFSFPGCEAGFSQ
jgi:hypothetical protein